MIFVWDLQLLANGTLSKHSSREPTRSVSLLTVADVGIYWRWEIITCFANVQNSLQAKVEHCTTARPSISSEYLCMACNDTVQCTGVWHISMLKPSPAKQQCNICQSTRIHAEQQCYVQEWTCLQHNVDSPNYWPHGSHMSTSNAGCLRIAHSCYQKSGSCAQWRHNPVHENLKLPRSPGSLISSYTLCWTTWWCCILSNHDGAACKQALHEQRGYAVLCNLLIWCYHSIA